MNDFNRYESGEKEMDELEVEDIGNKILLWTWKHKSLIAILILILFSVIMVGIFRSSLARQAEMEQQIERQNDIIDGLRANSQTSDKSDESVITVSSETLKSQLGPLQELVTQEYIYTNADKRESKDTWIFGWTRPFSENSLLVTYDGTIKAGINFGAIDIDVDEESRTITVILPASVITVNNIPQESITVVEVKNGLFNDVTFDDYNEFISEQKIIMEQRAIERGLLTSADEQARTLVKNFLTQLLGTDAYTIIVK